eukprot:TRINITY_DN5792_c0_g2_i1.p1 TRINITY_DN5792_c0_g2~~TRINITY_DN5792_c0_g2_i1.p1  ORF type:complete len:319 (-),score=91.30 TRINITY_DN5792_c0_g2_i1:174-1130(-)
MADYTGSGFDGQRIRHLEKQREDSRRQFEERRKQLEKANDVTVASISDKFAKKTDSAIDKLKEETVGRVSVDQYRKVREELEQNEKDKRRRQEGQEEAKKKKKVKTANMSKLSFSLDGDDEENEDEQGNGDAKEDKNATEKTPVAQSESAQKFKIGKDPRANAEFLPDRERDEKERLEREEIRRKWLEDQEKIKEESIQITYSYWDGSGHRRSLTCKKGYTIGQFLELVKLEFKELRANSVDSLMYVKEDLIIPQHFTFYELIVTKARGKSGPLFHFDVHDDIRVVSDATVEKDESHAGKVLERRWYDKNKHTFPACR